MTRRTPTRKAKKPAIVEFDEDDAEAIAEGAVLEPQGAESELDATDDSDLPIRAESMLLLIEPDDDGQPDLRLPAELVLQVLELLAEEGQLQTIRRLAMASKMFYRLAEPLLVRDLSVGELPRHSRTMRWRSGSRCLPGSRPIAWKAPVLWCSATFRQCSFMVG